MEMTPLMAKYTADQLKTMLSKGQAMKNADGEPSYPIADAEDLSNAIHAVGLGNKANDSIRKYIIGRAKALGLSKDIPDTWNADGSLKGASAKPQIGDVRAAQTPGDLASATDASLDEAMSLLDGVDTSGLDPVVQQALALLQAAGASSDQLLDAMGIDDPDDDELDDARSLGQAYETRGLLRTFEFRVASDPQGDGNTLEGIAATFNDWTTIQDIQGPFREQVAPSAFNKTLRETKPVLMFNHGQHPMVGDMPIGAFEEIKPRAAGLYVRARLADNWLVSPVRDAIANGSISGMSFRFNVIKDSWAVGSDSVPERTLREVGLPELGPVVFPAYTNTAVSVRSREILTALGDPSTRAEIARALLIGTPSGAAATEPRKHSGRTQSQNRALALLATI